MSKVGTILAAVMLAAATSTAGLAQAGGGGGTAGDPLVLPEVLAAHPRWGRAAAPVPELVASPRGRQT